jgi:hypothetical protein
MSQTRYLGIAAFKFIKDANGQAQAMVLKQVGTERRGQGHSVLVCGRKVA